ncbi:MAG: hypothetical protein ACLTDX_01405 [[Clostridium] innocuum]
MKKLLRGFFTAAAAVFLCSSCKGIPPENEAMSKALQDRDVTYSIVALDDKCFYLSLENKDLIFDYLLETDRNKAGGSYYSMEITTKKTDSHELSVGSGGGISESYAEENQKWKLRCHDGR